MTMPAIDYTDKDFASLRAAMLRLASQRLPEWTDRSPSDLIMVFIDLFAYCGDIVAYYQDRIASEMFPATATERASLVDLLRLIGYEFSPATPARTDLRLTFKRPVAPADPRTVTITHGAKFRANDPTDGAIEFIYLGEDLTLDLTSAQVRPDEDPEKSLVHYDGLPVEQGELTAGDGVLIGSGTGEPGQSFALPGGQVNLDSVVVEVNEGAQWVQWHRASPEATTSDLLAREYRLIVDAADVSRAVFANRVVPAAIDNVRARYRLCRGARGNVAAGTITESAGQLPALAAVTNPVAAAGGSDLESAASAVRNAPKAFRSMQRAVTAEDYVALALRTGAVAKVRVRSPSWNRVELYVAPTGTTLTPLSESMRNYLLAYFEHKRSVCTVVEVFGARPVAIDIGCAVDVDKRFAVATVLADVRAAISDLLAFGGVDFAQTLYVSDVYAAVEAVKGVLGVTINRFRRADYTATDIDAELARSGLPPLAQLPDVIRSAVSAEVESSGRIATGDFEIPVLGALDVRAAQR